MSYMYTVRVQDRVDIQYMYKINVIYFKCTYHVTCMSLYSTMYMHMYMADMRVHMHAHVL
jgi:hypothetical protein